MAFPFRSHVIKAEAAIRLINSWFSHDVTKIQITKLLIFLRFYFNDV